MGNALHNHSHKVDQLTQRVGLQWFTVVYNDVKFRYVTSYQDQLSLAIPPWVGAMSISESR